MRVNSRMVKNALVHKESGICLVFIGYLFIMLLPFLPLPPFWDGVNFLNYAFMTPLKNYDLAFANYGHPPLFFWLFGTVFALCGYSNVAAHVLLFILGSSILLFTFHISKMLFDTETALLTSAFLAVSPLFLATVINPNLDIVVLAFLMPSYYFFLKKRYFLYAILGTCTVMSKESGILWVGIIWLTFLIDGLPLCLRCTPDPRSALDKGLAFVLVSVPLLILLGWMLANKSIFGWYIYQRNNPFFTNLNLLHPGFLISMKQLFVTNFNWILSLIILVSITLLLVRTMRGEGKGVGGTAKVYLSNSPSRGRMIALLPMILLFLAYLIVVAPIDDFKPIRYGILVYPFFFLLSAVILQQALRKNLVRLFSVLFLCLLFLQNFSSIDLISRQYLPPNVDTGSELEYNTEFTTYVSLEKEGFDYLQDNLGGRKIIFDWWNPLVVIEAAQFNEKNLSFGYNADSSWGYVWLRDFFTQPDFQENHRYVYMTHKINEEHHTIEKRCRCSEEFYREIHGKELWIYGVQNCQGE